MIIPSLSMDYSDFLWQYSGGHYAAPIVLFIIVAGILGLGYRTRQLSRLPKLRHCWLLFSLTAVSLLVSAACRSVDDTPTPKPETATVVSLPTPTPSPILLTPTATLVSVPTPVPTPSPTSMVRSPLTGLPVKDVNLFKRRPLAVKIDNAPGARPQSGLAQAAIVYEHLAEWGITRFTAFYLTEDVEVIGPVRSARLVDLELMPEYKALFAHVGASQPIMQMFASSDILDLDQWWNPQAYYRSRQRPSPYNVYTSVDRLRSLGRQKGWEGPVELSPFPFVTEPVAPSGKPVNAITIPYSQTHVRYQYDEASNTYLRFTEGAPHLDAQSGEQIRVTNLVVEYVKTITTNIIEDALGARSLKHELVGEGKVEVFRDGQAYTGRWVRKTEEDRTNFLDEAGKPLSFRPGNTWISLVPLGMAITKE